MKRPSMNMTFPRISGAAPLSLLSFNARSIMILWSIFINEIRTYNSNIGLISESCMRNNRDSNLFNFDDYIAFSDCREDRRGGNVLILVKSHLRPTLVKQRIECNRCIG